MAERLPSQPWMTAAQRVMQALESERRGSARFVGGCVRNALLGEPVADIDIATQLTPERVTRAMMVAGIAVHPTGIEHGTLTVVADHRPYEVTTLRRDVETDGRRAVVAFTEEWAEDAQRRDFRMNALYAEPDGTLHDPTGGGRADIAARRIVFVGEPEMRIREDYLRILRFFRFNAWYAASAPDPAGLAACAKLKAGLAGISAERIWSETLKLLGAPDPRIAVNAWEQSGVFAALFPESSGATLLFELVGLERARGLDVDAMLRFLSLFGKDEPALSSLARQLKLSKEERDRLIYTARFDAPLDSHTPPEELRRLLYRFGRIVIRDTALLAWAKAGADAPGWADLVARAENYERPIMPVSGDDLLAAGVAPGPPVGLAMRKLEAAWIKSDFSAGRETLLGLLV